SLPQVDKAVCQALRLPDGALQTKQRSWAVSHPRMLAMFLARKHTAAAYNEIGQHFGGRNHSTVLAAEKKVRTWVRDDGELGLGGRADDPRPPGPCERNQGQRVKGVAMKRFALTIGAVLGIVLSSGVAKAGWGSLTYSGYQPCWNIFAHRYKCLTPEEKRLQH